MTESYSLTTSNSSPNNFLPLLVDSSLPLLSSALITSSPWRNSAMFRRTPSTSERSKTNDMKLPVSISLNFNTKNNNYDIQSYIVIFFCLQVKKANDTPSIYINISKGKSKNA